MEIGSLPKSTHCPLFLAESFSLPDLHSHARVNPKPARSWRNQPPRSQCAAHLTMEMQPHTCDGLPRAAMVQDPSPLHWRLLMWSSGLSECAGEEPSDVADNWQTSCTPAQESGWSLKPVSPGPKMKQILSYRGTQRWPGQLMSTREEECSRTPAMGTENWCPGK